MNPKTCPAKRKMTQLIIIAIILIGIVLTTILITKNYSITGKAVQENEYYCTFEVLQDRNFTNGFVETWLTNLQDSQKCSISFENKNPYWHIQEITTYQHFCKNLPQPKSTSPYTITANSNFWEYNSAWKIKRNWNGGGAWQYDSYWKAWAWYQKDPNNEKGTGWRVIIVPKPKQLISYKNGNLQFIIDTSYDENKGCRINTQGTGLVNLSNKLWWTHYGIHQPIANLKLSDYSSLVFNISYKINNISFKNRCTNK